MNSELRLGRFTSSEICALMTQGNVKGSFGKPALTYIEETNMERRLGRCIDIESNAKPLLWGKLVEGHVFELLGTEYKLVSQETLTHSSVEFWAGSPDAIKYTSGKPETVCDIKAPLTLKSFCQLVDAWNAGGIDAVRADHRDGEKYYWQLVSNACITGCKYAELIVYAPYRSNLDGIRQLCEGDGKYYRIFFADDSELPWIPAGGYYKSLNVLRFEVPTADKIALHERVVEAGKFLIDVPKLQTV